jgi:hypothetical protein
MQLPLNDTIVAAMAQLVDDARADAFRDPTHSELDFYINRSCLQAGDPKTQGPPVGKAKRLRGVLSYAIDQDPAAGSKLVESVLSKLKACGGFRAGSTNYVGEEAIMNAIAAFDAEGFLLSTDGTIGPKNLDGLSNHEITDALRAHARRAQRGAEDAALLLGTGKDLLEATAAHVLVVKTGAYPTHSNFETLLGQAYTTLRLTLPLTPVATGEHPRAAMERAFFQTAISVNKMRNKEGTGHGKPWMPTVTTAEAKAAIEVAGTIVGFLLDKL